MQRVLKILGLVLGGLLLLLILTATALYFVGGSRHAERYDVQVAALSIPSTPEAIERGGHLADVHGCTYCHTANLGGQIFVDEAPFRMVASNLTSGAGGVGDRYDPPAWDRAIRHGVGWDGRPLQVMPSAAFHNLSDEDAAAIIAYLEHVPAVDNELPESEIRPLGRVLSAVVMDPAMEVSAEPARATSPPPGPTKEYGEYLSSITCAYCHGPGLVGAQPPEPGSPPAPDLAPAGQWSVEDFKRALRTGMTPGGRQLDGAYMPYAVTALMTDEELEALHAYFATLIEARD